MCKKIVHISLSSFSFLRLLKSYSSDDIREETKRKVFTRNNVGFICQALGFRSQNFSCSFGWVPLPFPQTSGSPFRINRHRLTILQEVITSEDNYHQKLGPSKNLSFGCLPNLTFYFRTGYITFVGDCTN